jgi:hypothetical protein
MTTKRGATSTGESPLQKRDKDTLNLDADLALICAEMDKDVSQPPLVKLLLNLVQRFISRENSLFDQINSLTSRLQQLEETQPDNSSKGQQNFPLPDNIDAEEKERLRSVVISGIEEAHPSATSSARRAHNKKAINDILDQLDIDSEPVCVYRMGVPDPKRPRLLKAVLPSSTIQRQLLRNSRKLASFPAHKNTFIRPSLTKQQRDNEYNLRKEMRERRQLGEKVKIQGGPPGAADRKVVSFEPGNE